MKFPIGSVLLSAAAVTVGAVVLARSKGGKAGPRNVDAAVPYLHGSRIERYATIAAEPGAVYAAWRDFERLPGVMPNLSRVDVVDAETSRWYASVPGGGEVAWNATLIADVPGERIAWQTHDAPAPHAGAVLFKPAPGGRGTEVTVEIEFVPPGGALGGLMGKALTASPMRLVDVDLRRFKSMIEAGDVALNGTDVSK